METEPYFGLQSRKTPQSRHRNSFCLRTVYCNNVHWIGKIEVTQSYHNHIPYIELRANRECTLPGSVRTRTHIAQKRSSQKREDRPHCRFTKNRNSRRSSRGIIAQKAPTETPEIKRPYDAAEIRSLPLDEQGRLRKVYLQSWQAIRSGSKKKSGAQAAKEIGIPVRTLYEWRRKPVPESTRSHNVRKRKDPKRYAELKDKVLDFRREQESWGRTKIQYLMTVANHSISVAMVGRMLSELIQDGLIKSYFGTCAKPRRSTPLPPRPYAEERPEDLESTKPGGVVQFDTMFVKNPKTKKYVYHINAICCFTRISFSLVFDTLSACNASLLLEKVIRKCQPMFDIIFQANSVKCIAFDTFIDFMIK